jgi:chromosome segregation ATPase
MSDDVDKQARDLFLQWRIDHRVGNNAELISLETRVAAALREAYEKGEQSVAWFKKHREAQAEIAKLKAELEAARAYIGEEMLRSDFQTATQMRSALETAHCTLASMEGDLVQARQQAEQAAERQREATALAEANFLIAEALRKELREAKAKKRELASNLKAELERAHQSANERNVREKALYDECVNFKTEIERLRSELQVSLFTIERLEREIARLHNDVEP